MKNKTRPSIRVSIPFCLTLLLTAFFFQACKKNDSSPATPPVTPPSITDFSPKKGLVGATIIITGTNFDAVPSNNVVKFNGVTAAVTQSSATQLTVTVPQNASSGKISATVANQMGMSAVDFVVRPPLKLSGTSGITNQILYVTGGNGFGTVPDSNGFSLYSSGLGRFSDILGYNEDTLVFLVPYDVPGVYTDSVRVDGIMISMGTFTVDTPALTTFGIVGNVTPGTAAKGATVTVPVINGSTVAGSTTVSLVQLYQHTGTPVSIPCTVNSLTAGAFGTTTISFVVPNGIITGTGYAVKVTYNGVTAYGGLNSYFTGG